MRPADTTPEAWEQMIQIYRTIGPSGRLRIAFNLATISRSLLEGGIKNQYPDYSKEEVHRELTRRWLHNDALFSQVYETGSGPSQTP